MKDYIVVFFWESGYTSNSFQTVIQASDDKDADTKASSIAFKLQNEFRILHGYHVVNSSLEKSK